MLTRQTKLSALILCVVSAAAAVAAAADLHQPEAGRAPEEAVPERGGLLDALRAPLHFTVYGVDPQKTPTAPPIGYVFWTTDMVPQRAGVPRADPPARRHGPHGHPDRRRRRLPLRAVRLLLGAAAGVRRSVQGQEHPRPVPRRRRHRCRVARDDQHHERRARRPRQLARDGRGSSSRRTR